MGALAIETLVSGELACEAFDLLSDSDLQINLCRTCRNIFHGLNKYYSFLNKYREGVLSIETLVQVLHSQEALTCSYLISISKYIFVRFSGDTTDTAWVEAQILLCYGESVKTFLSTMKCFHFTCFVIFFTEKAFFLQRFLAHLLHPSNPGYYRLFSNSNR